MPGLKILVILMGVLLVGGFVALVVAIAGRMPHHAPPPPGAAFTAPPITLPHGAKIEMMTAGTDRIVLEIALADGSAELVVIDLASGRQLGLIPLQEAK